MSGRIFLSNTDRKIGGVCGGLGEYFNVDATLMRLLWIIFGLTGAGIIAYIIAWAIIPKKPSF